MSGPLCECGHYEHEHERIELAGWTSAHTGCPPGTRAMCSYAMPMYFRESGPEGGENE